MPRKQSPKPSDVASASSATTNTSSLQFISSEIARVPRLDIATSSPDRLQIWKQRWKSVLTITGFFLNSLQKPNNHYLQTF